MTLLAAFFRSSEIETEGERPQLDEIFSAIGIAGLIGGPNPSELIIDILFSCTKNQRNLHVGM